MRTLALAILGLGLVAQACPSLAQHRELGAHEHGRGTLNIALEGTRLTLELEVPGVDIVGFEHKAKSRKDKAAVDTARKQLAKPLALFKLPASAGCAVKEASATVEGEEHDHDHGKGAKGKDAKGSDHASEHSQFHAQYALDCKAPADITSIEFDYFRTFAGAQKLEVNLITPKGQDKFEVTRAKPRLDLAGKM
jgi:uncharacterized protein DUF2796